MCNRISKYNPTGCITEKLSKGQALGEFALIIPVILLLVMGAMDLGKAFYVKIRTESAAREGAYHLAYNPTDVTACSGGVCQPGAGTLSAIQNEANYQGVQIDLIEIKNCCTMGSPVEVTVGTQVRLFIINFITGPIRIKSTVRMMVLQ